MFISQIFKICERLSRAFFWTVDLNFVHSWKFISRNVLNSSIRKNISKFHEYLDLPIVSQTLKSFTDSPSSKYPNLFEPEIMAII